MLSPRGPFVITYDIVTPGVCPPVTPGVCPPVTLVVSVGGREVLLDEDSVLWPLSVGGSLEVPHISLYKSLALEGLS